MSNPIAAAQKHLADLHADVLREEARLRKMLTHGADHFLTAINLTATSQKWPAAPPGEAPGSTWSPSTGTTSTRSFRSSKGTPTTRWPWANLKGGTSYRGGHLPTVPD